MSSAIPAKPRLVLASASPRRQELISLLGLPVRVMPSGAAEDTPEEWSPGQIVEELSLRKALAVKKELTEPSDESSIVIGSDTIVVLNGIAMGKPKDELEAVHMLRQLSGKTHEVYTGVSCVKVSDGRTVTSHRVTKVRMRTLTDDQIARYVATGEPMDKAGAYGIQEVGALLVESIEGDYFNVVGLPVSLLAVLLEQFEITVP
ncbi:Maf family protein [Cohnella terricola]|uniref:dTTP/UTP pyrophosphatase n=1 Tax=Cohnella terricola TaxID=1289167 RepID=A0A559JVZ8_9BACL|nr:Maf family protein [Cohnella terricola]TVY04053.1 septum formation inhibitor Maf [Cohnella terricola]